MAGAAAAMTAPMPSIAKPALSLQWRVPASRCTFLSHAIRGFGIMSETYLTPGLVPLKHVGQHDLMCRCQFAVLHGLHKCGASIFNAMTVVPYGNVLPRPGMNESSSSFCLECLLLQLRTLKVQTAVAGANPAQAAEIERLLHGIT